MSNAETASSATTIDILSPATGTHTGTLTGTLVDEDRVACVIDPIDMRFVDVSRGTCEATGYSRAELLSMGPSDIGLDIGFDIAAIFACLDAAESGLRLPACLRLRRRDGTLEPLRMLLSSASAADRELLIAVASSVPWSVPSSVLSRNTVADSHRSASFIPAFSPACEPC